MRTMKTVTISLLVAAVISDAGYARSDDLDEWDHNYAIQALLGGVKYADLEFQNEDAGGETITVDMTTLPQLGGAWMTRPKGDRFQYGLETSFLLGFRLDEIKYAYAGAGGTYVSISTSMWMIDFSGGAYGNLQLGKALRLYGGAGPLLMFASYKSEQEYDAPGFNSSQSESVFGFGAYARTGLELQIQPRGWLGAGVRWNWSNADFGDVGGSTDISGIGAFITYTAGL